MCGTVSSWLPANTFSVGTGPSKSPVEASRILTCPARGPWGMASSPRLRFWLPLPGVVNPGVLYLYCSTCTQGVSKGAGGLLSPGSGFCCRCWGCLTYGCCTCTRAHTHRGAAKALGACFRQAQIPAAAAAGGAALVLQHMRTGVQQGLAWGRVKGQLVGDMSHMAHADLHV